MNNTFNLFAPHTSPSRKLDVQNVYRSLAHYLSFSQGGQSNKDYKRGKNSRGAIHSSFFLAVWHEL